MTDLWLEIYSHLMESDSDAIKMQNTIHTEMERLLVPYKNTITEEENAAIDQAHEIVAERYKQLGMEQTAWEKEHLEYALQGRLRFDGIEGMLNWARTAVISKGKSSTPRGYC